MSGEAVHIIDFHIFWWMKSQFITDLQGFWKFLLETKSPFHEFTWPFLNRVNSSLISMSEFLFAKQFCRCYIFLVLKPPWLPVSMRLIYEYNFLFEALGMRLGKIYQWDKCLNFVLFGVTLDQRVTPLSFPLILVVWVDYPLFVHILCLTNLLLAMR